MLSSATFWLGNFAAFCALQIQPAQWIAQFATAKLFGAVIITAFILATNWLSLQITVTSTVNLISVFFRIGIIDGGVNAFLKLLPKDSNPPHSVEPKKLLARIPMAKRGDLISLIVTDHYVEVTTKQGKHLMLMRFPDALAEIPSGISMQVHRLYWVAQAQIEGHIYNGRR